MKRMMLCSLIIALLLPLLVACGGTPAIKVEGKSYTYLPDSGNTTMEGVEFTESQQASFKKTLNRNFKDSVLTFSSERDFEYTYSIFNLPSVTARTEGKRSGNVIEDTDGFPKVEILEDRVILTVKDLIYDEGSITTVVFVAAE